MPVDLRRAEESGVDALPLDHVTEQLRHRQHGARLVTRIESEIVVGKPIGWAPVTPDS